MTRKPGRSPRRRNVFIVLLLFGAMGALVVMAHLRPPADLPTEEPPELTAKRRDSENNAYYALVDAFNLLPTTPSPLQLTDEDGWKYDYKAEDNSLGSLVSIARPDDDNLLLEYIQQSRPAMESAIKALDKPWFLLPEIPRARGQDHFDSLRLHRDLRRLPNLFLATAIIQPCSEDPAQDGCAFLDGAVRLIALLNQDGPPMPLPAQPGVIEVIRKASPEHRKQIGAWIQEFRAKWTPPDTYIDACIRGAYLTTFADFQNDREPEWGEKTVFAFLISREKRRLRRNEEHIREAGRMTYCQFDAYARMHPEIREYRPRYVAPTVQNFLTPNSRFFANVDSVPIAIALETHKRDKGQYPESLAALVPEYLPQLPKTPFDGQDYTYQREGDSDYALYCRGGHRQDVQDNNWRQAQFIVFHAPPGPEGRAWTPLVAKGR